MNHQHIEKVEAMSGDMSQNNAEEGIAPPLLL